MNLAPSHFRDLAPEHFPVLHLEPRAPPSPPPYYPPASGRRHVNEGALRCEALVCMGRPGSSPTASHGYQCRSARTVRVWW